MNTHTIEVRRAPRGERCPRTELAIPECSCPVCLDDQMRRVMRGMRALRGAQKIAGPRGANAA